mmetsp:Transcript_76/g.169  ORF Transcript_76/g.169 Transcript_76/m.169 type:complete len:343 (-) Transcript_76:158-1186(-)
MMVTIALLLTSFVTLVGYALAFLLWILGIATFLVWWNQEFLLYQPTFTSSHGEGRQTPFNPKGYRTPKEMHLPFEDVYLDTEDGTCINGWLILQPQSENKPCILYFHGNAGNIGHRLPGLKELYQQSGCNIFIIDYRGYGNSSGTPSEGGLILDAKASLNYLVERANVDNKNIIIFGRSLGGAVAIATAAKYQDKIRGVIVENTFTQIDDMATVILSRLARLEHETTKKLLPFLYFYLTNSWRSIERIPLISKPMLFISGLEDKLIPPEQMKSLIKAAVSANRREVLEVKDGQHNNTVEAGGQAYYDKFNEFTKSIVEEVSPHGRAAQSTNSIATRSQRPRS